MEPVNCDVTPEELEEGRRFMEEEFRWRRKHPWRWGFISLIYIVIFHLERLQKYIRAR
jgi:hypothetical protein